MGFRQSPFPMIEGTTGHKNAAPTKSIMELMAAAKPFKPHYLSLSFIISSIALLYTLSEYDLFL